MLMAETTVLRGSEASQKIENAAVIRYNDFTSIPNYIQFKSGKEIPLSKLEGWLNQFYKSNIKVSLKLLSKQDDQLGFTHYRYQQVINGVPVELANYIAHVKNGVVVSANGELLDDLNTSLSTSLSESFALEKAIDFVGAESYKWESKREENHIKIEQNNPFSTYYPKGELVLINKEGKITEQLVLAYKFNIYAHKPMSRAEFFIDANTGELVWEENKIHHSDVVGAANTTFSGIQAIVSDSLSVGNYRLRETGRGNGIKTYNSNNSNSYPNIDFTNNSQNWTLFSPQYDSYAIDAHWGAEMTYDYYYSEHARNSIDNNGFSLISYIHYGQNYNNAFFDGQRMTYGDGFAGGLTQLDIVAHEITHGVTMYTAGLIYQGEPGALNESFSDIFGVTIDFNKKPTTADWMLGHRNLSNPNISNQPDTYFGNNWASLTGGDNGGVHTNSGVQNYWYYLLSNGGIGVNDNGDHYNVSGQGINKASLIAYRNLSVYLTSSSDFADARFFAIQSAVDLYGNCSVEVAATAESWYAVGVGSQGTGLTPISDFASSLLISCNLPFTVAYNNLSSNATIYLWDFGDGVTSSQVNPTHVYTNYGNFTVSLIADEGVCGADTSEKSAYVIINEPIAPTVIGDTVCMGNSAILEATGSGVINWYDSPLSVNVLDTGSTFVTPVITSLIDYYAESVTKLTSVYGAKSNTNGAGGSYNGNEYLIFDVFKPIELESVEVTSWSSGNRVIELRNSLGQVLSSKVVYVSASTSRVELNFMIPVGVGYQLGLSSTSMIGLHQNTTGLNYPYNNTELFSIIKSSNNINGGVGNYYFFYDWKVNELCISSRVLVSAYVDNCTAYKESQNDKDILIILPNLSAGLINLKVSKSFDLNYISIFDLTGKKILTTDNTVIDINHLPKGIYILKIVNIKGGSIIKKVVLE